MSEPRLLSSLQNPLLKEIRRAMAAGGLTAGGLAVAEGARLLEEAFRSRCEVPVVVVAESARERISVSPPEGRTLETIVVPDSLFAKLSDLEQDQGVMALVRPRTWHLEELLLGQPLLILLDGVQHPGNAGAILRVAEAFQATGVVFLQGSVNPYSPKCVRSSAGSVFRLPVVVRPELGSTLGLIETQKIRLYAAAPDGATPVDEADFSDPCAIVMGSEGHGISAPVRVRTRAVRIPTAAVESLNVAVAAGIILYEAGRQRRGMPNALPFAAV